MDNTKIDLIEIWCETQIDLWLLGIIPARAIWVSLVPWMLK